MNHLQYETSPYLLQHAHNPVNWYAWKPEAFEKARQENKPILVSIGYSTCHWCHVMERESFENEEVARFMNENFVNIKVDREERPDVDQIYMEACQIINGNGGWPLNCFLLPDGRPFYAGTYYPPRPAHQRPSWTQVLENLSNAYKNQYEVVEEQAEKLMNVIQKSDTSLLGNAIEGLDGKQVFTPVIVQNLYYNLHQRFDAGEGGFGTSPKFPGTMNLEFLLKYHYFSKSEEALQHLQLSLDKMIMGGIYDQIGGGFARYATDRAWLIPHFEKMLYDNALLVSLLSETYKFTRKDLYKETIEETLDWVAREMTDENGGFYSALDADSEGVEGKFYIWDKAEIEEVLSKSSFHFNKFYDVSENGNWEGKNILNRNFEFETFCEKERIEDCEKFKRQIKISNKKLLEKRSERIRPGLDDKILLDWNALMISAYAKAYAALGIEAYKNIAKKTLDFILEKFTQKDGITLFHTYKNGQAQYDAFLDDYAFLIEALIDVYEITFDTQLLLQADRYTKFVLEHFLDKDSNLFYFTSSNQVDLVTRRKDLYDSATPSGNSTMVRNLQRLGIIFENENYRNLAREMLMNVRDAVEKHPTSFGRWAEVLTNEVYGIKEIAVVGKGAFEKGTEIQELFIPNKIVMATTEENEEFPLFKGKKTDSDTYIYICVNYACQKPVRTIEAFKENLEQL